MTDAQEPEGDFLFVQLIASFQTAAMLQMGKIMSPVSGKIERDMDQAKTTIAMLEMLQSKTEGNLSGEEKRLIDHILYELRMNFLDESKSPTEESAAPEAGGTEAKSESAPAESDHRGDEQEAGEERGEHIKDSDETA